MALNLLLNCSSFDALTFDMLNENKSKEGKDQQSIQSSPGKKTNRVPVAQCP